MRQIHHKLWRFPENETISKYFTLKSSQVFFFYQDVKILESKLRIHVFFVLCGKQVSTIPRSVASLFQDMVSTFNHAAPVKNTFSLSGITAGQW